MKKTTLARLLAAGSVAALSAPVFAVGTPVDVTDGVANIAAQSAPIALVAGAVFLIIVGIKTFKWVRRAL